ncbi:MAG: PP2C family protein-serine/threonine phosphatase [Paracoccaceae bacterium]
MRPSPKIQFDVASAICQGRRKHQEDAIIIDFPLGADLGFAVLADGMGGHLAGDVASKIVVTEVFSELKLQSGNQQAFEDNVADILVEAARAANECVYGHTMTNPETSGMGTTLVAPVFFGDRLFWISIGDSPLFLYRDGVLMQLNEDHSMAPQIDYMVESGVIPAESGKNHPDRNCLTSVLIGSEIARIDCPKDPLELCDGDVLIVASDGLQFLSNGQIEEILNKNSTKNSSDIAEILLANLEELGDPEQDNISFCVIKIRDVNRSKIGQDLQAASEAKNQVPFNSCRSDGGFAAAARQSVPRPLSFLRRSPESRGGTA